MSTSDMTVRSSAASQDQSKLAKYGRPCLRTAGDLGIALAIIGVSALIVMACLQGSVTSTRVDFIASYRSHIPGDFSISEKATQFTDPNAVSNLWAMAIIGGVGAGLLIPAAAYSYYQLRKAQEALQEAEKNQAALAPGETQNDEAIKALRERVKTYTTRTAILVPIALFLATLCVASAVVLGKSTTFSGDTYRWDPKYIWTYCGGWLKTGSFHSTLLNVGAIESLKTAGIAIMTVGGALALTSYALYLAKMRTKSKENNRLIN